MANTNGSAELSCGHGHVGWVTFFVLAGISNLAQSWFFYFCGDATTSGAALLGFRPSMPQALLVAAANAVVAIGAGEEDVDLVAEAEHAAGAWPEWFCSGWDAGVWATVGLAGVAYLAHGLRGASGALMPPWLVAAFAALKLSTACTLTFLWLFGSSPGPLTAPIGVSEVFWGALFLRWAMVTSPMPSAVKLD